MPRRFDATPGCSAGSARLSYDLCTGSHTGGPDRVCGRGRADRTQTCGTRVDRRLGCSLRYGSTSEAHLSGPPPPSRTAPPCKTMSLSTQMFAKIYHCSSFQPRKERCRDGGIGRRTGLKIRRASALGGSSPPPGIARTRLRSRSSKSGASRRLSEAWDWLPERLFTMPLG